METLDDFEENFPVVDRVEDVLIDGVAHKSGIGKFSLWFVYLAALVSVIIFAYAIVKLIKRCNRNKKREGDFFCRVEDNREDTDGIDMDNYDLRANLIDQESQPVIQQH